MKQKKELIPVDKKGKKSGFLEQSKKFYILTTKAKLFLCIYTAHRIEQQAWFTGNEREKRHINPEQ